MIPQNTIPKPTAILWDWDGTLVDTLPVVHQALNVLMTAFDRPTYTLDEVKYGIHSSGRDLFKRMFKNDAGRAREVYLKAFRENHLKALATIPHAQEFLDKAKANNIPMAVVSNKTGPYLRKEVTHLKFDHYFFNVVGAEDAAHDKPHPDVIAHALKDTKTVQNQSVWFVGDTIADMQCAHNNNFTGILVRDKAPEANEFPGCAPHLYVENLQLLTNCL